MNVRRRDFITLLSGAAAWPLAARAQTMPAVGYLSASSAAVAQAMTTAFLEGLKEGGFVDGRNVAIEYRSAEDHNDRLPGLAADLVRRRVTLIMANGTLSALAAKDATSIIPIVFQMGSDPVRAGLITSLNRPGGNITGVTNVSATIAAKRLDLLHQLTPRAATIGVLVDPTGGVGAETQKSDLEEAAHLLGLQLLVLNASNDQEIDQAFKTLLRQQTGALILTFYNGRRDQLVTLARFSAIPTMYTFREFAAAGGLISYASSLIDANRTAGNYVARILKGEKPGELPIQLPTKYELVINVKAAKAIGLAVPPALLTRADEVIE